MKVRNFLQSAFVLLLATVAFINSSQADTIYTFGPENALIDGSIKYTVVGRYHASFEEFEGKVLFDEKENTISSVDLLIKAGTINSGFETLDKIVKSKQILDVDSFADIQFKSRAITKTEEGYAAAGSLSLHGVTQEMTFPFSYERKQEGDKLVLYAAGKWVIPRKEFGVIWNKFLDKGGILVGNHITVEWSIEASKQEMNQ